MGVHFFAIVKCDPVCTVNDTRLSSVVRAGGVRAQKLAELAKTQEEGRKPVAGWVSATDFSEEIERPTMISSQVCFRTSEGFHLTFGQDSIGAWHPRRWPRFIRDAALQEALLEACRHICTIFNACDAVITRDESPIHIAHRSGLKFDDALKLASSEAHEHEVLAIHELYTVIDDGPLTWESRGFWRLPCGANER